MSKVKPKDFMAAVKVVNGRHQAAVRRYMRTERDGCAGEGFEAQQTKLKAMAKEIQDLHDEIGWLVGGLLAGANTNWGRLARETMGKLLAGRKG